MGRLRVQHCVLNMTTRQYGPAQTSDLLGVDYFRTVPADTEFPRTLGKLELFVRYIVTDLPATHVWITVHYLYPDGSDRQIVYRRRQGLPNTSGLEDVVIDRGHKLHNVVCPGEGVYAIRVCRRIRRSWDGTPRWRVLGREFFSVRRAT